VRHVIILKNGPPPNRESEPLPESELAIFVDRIEPRLLEVARRIEGVTQVRESVEMGCPMIGILTRRRMATLSQIESICRQLQILILVVRKRSLSVPTFDQPAELMPISNSTAVMELIRQFQPGYRSNLLTQGSSTQLYVELAAMIDQATCFQLRAGPLDETVDLLRSLG
jgi:hypothetical protein